MTNREIVDKLVNALKYNNKDESISRRFILKVFRDTAKWLISQKLLDRTIHKELNLYSEISCFEFENFAIFFNFLNNLVLFANFG